MKTAKGQHDRKRFCAVVLATALVTGLTACGSDTAADTQSTAASGTVSAATEETEGIAIDKAAYDALIASGIVADDADIAENAWASAVKKAGVLKVGGTRTSYLFSQLDETDNGVRGFDAGLYQLLARYILGDESKYEL